MKRRTKQLSEGRVNWTPKEESHLPTERPWLNSVGGPVWQVINDPRYGQNNTNRTQNSHRDFWTDARQEYLIDYAPYYSQAEIGRALGRPKTSVNSMFRTLMASGRVAPRSNARRAPDPDRPKLLSFEQWYEENY